MPQRAITAMGGYVGTEVSNFGGMQRLDETSYRLVPSLPFAYETLTFTTSGPGTLSITGNGTTSVSIFKTAGSAAWDTQAYTTVGYRAPVTLQFERNWLTTTDPGNSYSMIGLNKDATTDASYTSIDSAAYPLETDVWRVYTNGAGLDVPINYNTNDIFYIVYGLDGTVNHYAGSVLTYSDTFPLQGQTNPLVYIDSSFYSVNATRGGFNNIRLVKNAEWVGIGWRLGGTN